MTSPGSSAFVGRLRAWRIIRWATPVFYLAAAALVFAADVPLTSKPPATESYTPKGNAMAGNHTNFYVLYLDRHIQATQAAAANTNDFTAAWELGSACFELAEFATNNTQRAALAEAGIAASRQAIALKPDHAAGYYYLGMNLGQLARTKNLGALKLVSEMENAFHRSRKLDPQFSHAGADRCLGLLHRDAPGWPISVGNKRLARQHLREAVKLAPNYPENPLNWVETLRQWKELKEADAALKLIPAAMTHARTNLTGPVWDASWNDWTNRWHTLTNTIRK